MTYRPVTLTLDADIIRLGDRFYCYAPGKNPDVVDRAAAVFLTVMPAADVTVTDRAEAEQVFAIGDVLTNDDGSLRWLRVNEDQWRGTDGTAFLVVDDSDARRLISLGYHIATVA